MKIICFFNNKGGVGKTTLGCNIASSFAMRHAKRVLMLDADPQCNSTLLVLGEERAVSLYWPEIEKNSSAPDEATTLWSLLEPLELGETGIAADPKPLLGSTNRFGFDLLPGHPRTAIVEDRLATAWRDSLGGDVGGLKKTNWLMQLRQKLAGSYDYLFVDLGPSLGALNRSALLAADYFVAPMGADVFSVIGLRNIAEWLEGATRDYDQSLLLCEQRNPGRLDPATVKTVPTIRQGFAGYTVQSYIAKYKGGERRPTFAYEKIINNFPQEVQTFLGAYAAPGIAGSDFKLGEIPNMYSLVPLAQNANAPIAALKSSDGLVGTHYVQSQRYGEIIDSIVRRLRKNMGEQA